MTKPDSNSRLDRIAVSAVLTGPILMILPLLVLRDMRGVALSVLVLAGVVLCAGVAGRESRMLAGLAVGAAVVLGVSGVLLWGAAS